MRNPRSTFIYLLIILFAIFGFYQTTMYREDLLLYTLLFVPFTLLPFLFRRENVPQLKGQYIRPIYLFLLGFVIVHFQRYADFILGNVNLLNRITSLATSNKAALLSLAGLASVLLGYQWYKPKKKLIVKKDGGRIISITPLTFVYALLVVMQIVYFGDFFFQSKYGTESELGMNYLGVLLSAFFYVIVIINCSNASIRGITSVWKYFKSLGVPFVISWLIYLLMVMISGDRGPIITSIAALVFSYIIAVKKRYKLVTVVVAVIVAAVVVTMMGVARSMSKELSYIDRIKMSTFEYEKKSFSPYTTELAGSSRTLEYVVEKVPSEHPYLYGLFKFKEIINIVPFMSSITGGLFDPSYKYKGSASFATWIEQGESPSSGAGTTVVADLYIEFGWVSIVIGLFLFGMLLRKLDLIAFCNNTSDIAPFVLILSIVLFSSAIYIPRSTMLLQLRLIVWSWLIYALYKLMITKNVRR